MFSIDFSFVTFNVENFIYVLVLSWVVRWVPSMTASSINLHYHYFAGDHWFLLNSPSCLKTMYNIYPCRKTFVVHKHRFVLKFTKQSKGNVCILDIYVLINNYHFSKTTLQQILAVSIFPISFNSYESRLYELLQHRCSSSSYSIFVSVQSGRIPWSWKSINYSVIWPARPLCYSAERLLVAQFCVASWQVSYHPSIKHSIGQDGADTIQNWGVAGYRLMAVRKNWFGLLWNVFRVPAMQCSLYVFTE